MLVSSLLPWNGFTLGVTTSIIASVVVASGAWFYRQPLRRIFDRIFYPAEIDISGEWKTTFREGEQAFNEQVQLSQRGKRVWGYLVVEKQSRKIKYKFNGVFRSRILAAVYETTDRRDYEQGAFSLRYTSLDGAKCLVGQYIGISTDSENLFTSPYKWERFSH